MQRLCLLLAIVLFAAGTVMAVEAAVAQPEGVPPLVSLTLQREGQARDLWVTINNAATAVEVRHYAAADDPASDPPRHTASWGVTGYGSYLGSRLLYAHYYDDAQPDDPYYVVEWGGGPAPQVWGPYRLTVTTPATATVLLDGPQPHLVSLPLIAGE